MVDFPETHKQWLAERDRISPDGTAYIVEQPSDVIVICAGGPHNFGPTRAITRSF